MAEAEVVKLDPTAYWKGAAALVDAWANYQSVKKLLINATHDETRHKVQRIVDQYYGKSICRVREAEQERSQRVEQELHEFARLCERYEVEEVDRDWLFHKLRENKHYDSYRRKIKRRLAGWKPAQSLRDI